MEEKRIITAATRMTVAVLILFMISFVLDIAYGELTWGNFHIFVIPWAFGSLMYLIFSFRESRYRFFGRRTRYSAALISFMFMILLGSLPFMLTEKVDPFSAVFESGAGFTTTGLSTMGSDELMDISHGMLFFRVAIQWIGGLFYLVFAFMFLSDISDSAQRSADRKIFSRIGLVPTLGSLIQKLTIIYFLFTIFSTLAFYIGGRNLFDSVCLAMGTISTGGFSSEGRVIAEGAGILVLVTIAMFVTGMGYYVHLSLLSARGRSKTLFDTENITYMTIALTVPVIGFMILLADGSGAGRSALDGLFTTISALSTTGFMAEGMGDWPDSMKMLLLLLMLLGGSSLSLSSGFKVHRFFLLIKGFLAEVKRSSHPSAVFSLRRGEGNYSDKALESANMAFFYLFSLLVISTGLLLMFHGDLFEALTLCATSISNSGMAFGVFSTADGIESLNWFVKLVLVLIMILGRFEVLLPLYVLSLRGRRFTG
jgi:trk system potassium uptake protein TrkH